MLIQQNFTKRKKDVEEFFRLVSFISGIETHRRPNLAHPSVSEGLEVTMELQCIVKAQLLITLYNLVESTVCECLNTIYDVIADERLTYSQVSDDIRKMWKRHHKDKNHQVHTMTEEELITENRRIIFDNIAINISGSLDIRKIHEVFSKHGCALDNSRREKISNSFLVVKSKRNALAHGNTSFSECGSDYSMSDLNQIKEDIIEGLEDMITRVRSYITHREYAIYDS